VSNLELAQRLDEKLRQLEAATRDYDGGTVDDAVRIATSLRAIFHQTRQTTSLLGQLQARLVKVMTSVDKPPYPQDWYSPLADIEAMFDYKQIVVGPSPLHQPPNALEPTRYRPMLDRKKLTRQVQAAEWWGNEPVIIMHGKKTTRKDIVLWAANGARGSDDVASPGADRPHLAKRVKIAIDRDLIGPEIKVKDAYFAALWQMAYEVLKSPELTKLARQ
jgi:hypothetical protein